MGLARAAVHLLITEAAKRPFEGSVATLGRQHVYVTEAEVRSLADQYQVPLRSIPSQLHREPNLASQGFVSDDWLLTSLGFDTIVRLDYSDYESCEMILDLNAYETPESLRHRFDLVLDSGTLEHVFDFAAGLRHCVQMVRPGGRVVHLTPSSNCVEHGFYSVSPTLYADFYAASGFQVDRVWLCEIPIDLPRGTWKVYDYLGSPERFISLGQLSDKIWFAFSVSTALEGFEARTPQQWVYTRTWADAAKDSGSASSGYSQLASPQFEEGSKSQKLMSMLGRLPAAQRVVSQLILRWRKRAHQAKIRCRETPYPFLGKF